MILPEELPFFAIVGRPNVGKSSLFNCLVGARHSLVKNQPGVTRDWIYSPAQLWERHFMLADTGGLTWSKEDLAQRIKKQVMSRVERVDFFLVVMDYKSGLCSEDGEILSWIQKTGCPFALIINKVDRSQDLDLAVGEFSCWGKTPLTCSVENRLGLDPVLQWIYDCIGEKRKSKTHDSETFFLSLVGKPNVGKSTLCNQLLKSPEMLVSQKAGTTVDPVGFPLKHKGKNYILVDTGGLPKPRPRGGLETIASIKTHQTIEKSHIVLLVLDALQGPSEQEARIFSWIQKAHKTPLIVANKWDLAQSQIENFKNVHAQRLNQVFHFDPHLPSALVSAQKGWGLNKLLDKVNDLREKLDVRIPTKELNEFFTQVIRQAPAPRWRGREVKFYYITQTHQTPPSFIAFCNYPQAVHQPYQRFLEKQIQKAYQLESIPVRLFPMKRSRST